jgi:transcriptional regulator with XRE-family HTH domain
VLLVSFLSRPLLACAELLLLQGAIARFCRMLHPLPDPFHGAVRLHAYPQGAASDLGWHRSRNTLSHGTEHSVPTMYRVRVSMPKRHGIKPARAFGELVRAFREQRGWTQQQLADRWGFSREYVSLIELGKRKLYGEEQVLRLAEILEIPLERLAAIGKYVPQRLPAHGGKGDPDDLLLDALLEPARSTVKLSWLVWYANGDNSVVRDLADIVTRLESAVRERRGRLHGIALEILAYAHEMMGKVAFDKLQFPDAQSHFREMHELGIELGNPDVAATALIHQADLARRQGRYKSALRWLDAAEPSARAGRPQTAGMRWQTLARAHAEYGNRPGFAEAITHAHECVASIPDAAEASNNDFTALEVLHERAHGHVLLSEPDKALEIYAESERRVAFRPLRDLGNLTILRAQAYAHANYVEEGVDLAIEGLQLARRYESQRHVSRVRRMHDRLAVTPMGKHPRMADLWEALETQ